MKCQSKSRKRNQYEIPLLTTSKSGAAQTEECGKTVPCGVEDGPRANLLELAQLVVEGRRKATPIECDRHVGETSCRLGTDPEYPWLKLQGEAGGHQPPRLNINQDR